MCSKAIKKLAGIIDPIASKVFGGLLGDGGGAPTPAPPPPPAPLPPPPPPPPEIQDVREDRTPQRSASRRRGRGRAGTIFTSPLGDDGRIKSLLG